MRQNQKNRFNVRHNNRGHRHQVIYRNTALDSNGPNGKLHGTALQLFEKYQAAAKDALIQNDAVLAETYLQFADHYMRLQNQAIANEEALRSNNQRRQETKQASAVSADELPVFEIPTEVPSSDETMENCDEAQTIEKISASNEVEIPEQNDDILSLEGVDLSFPMSAIQAKNAEEKPTTKRRSRTLRVKKQDAVA